MLIQTCDPYDKDRGIWQTYLQSKIDDQSLAVVYPKDGLENSAKLLANLISDAIGIGQFVNNCGQTFWGVLIDKVGMDRKQIEESVLKLEKEKNNFEY